MGVRGQPTGCICAWPVCGAVWLCCTVLCMFDVLVYAREHTHTRYAIMLHRGKKDYPAAVRYGSHEWRCVTSILLC